MRTLFLIISLLMPLASFCHNYFHEGMKWETLCIGESSDGPGIEYLTSVTYLEKADETTYSMYSKLLEHDSAPRFIAYIKTENDKVLFSFDPEPSATWYLFYDFSMKPGDSKTIFTPYRNHDNEPPFSAEIKCTGIETDSENSNWERMLLEVQHDKNGEWEPESGYWIKDLTSPLGIDFNIQFGFSGIYLLQYKVYENNELIYASGSDPRTGIRDNYDSSDRIRIVSSDNSVEITSQENNTVEIYSASGVLISRTLIQKDIPTTIPLTQKGIAMLRIGDRTYKIKAK